MNRIRRASLLLGLMSLAACYSHRATTAPLASNERARIRFAAPQDVYVMQGADSSVVLGVEELIGQVRVDRGDSLWLLFDSARDTNRVDHMRPSGAMALVVRRPGTTIELRRIDKGKTVGAVILGTVVATATIGLIALSNAGSSY